MFAVMFGQMMQNGLLKQSDPAMLALAFTSPITSLVHLYTREPDREAEVMERIERFVRYFIAINQQETDWNMQKTLISSDPGGEDK